MTRIDVLMPQMGESIAEGTLSKWLKKLGDEVKRDEPLFEISTDKVDAEIPAPSAGVLTEIKVQEGQTVPVQTLVAVIETDKGAARPAAASPAPAPASAPPKPAPAPKAAPVPAATSPVLSQPSPSSPVAPKGDGAETAEERLRRKSTPLVRKIAAEHQVDISTIPGTGFAGRVTKQDILGFIDRGAPGIARAPSPEPRVPATGPITHPVVEPWPGDRVEPFSKIRKITADHMIMSRRTSAHVTSFFEVDYSRIAELRRKHKAVYAERGINLTYLAFIAKACAENLRAHPVVNAAVSGDTIIYRGDVNIGIAVALDWGLIVPVVKRADELSLAGLARAINDLGDRARTKKLSPDEIQRGTFTITNPGVFGSYAGAPIINQPQVAILGVGAIEKRPKVVTLPDGSDTIAIRTMGMVSMSYDHRVVDGADADRFLADVKRALETFPEGAV
ncbi:MAG TPA: 2-oxoglutarate dehydrogenase, E2 component, dihydrolipoamide succinyltransferase [Gemmatimonadales bacterium]|nr:2-oxoglutarate dehydrogenase, E2 component, dihydrolipoamide succinyltransferase [Gemmatimonadales bacterium]